MPVTHGILFLRSRPRARCLQNHKLGYPICADINLTRFSTRQGVPANQLVPAGNDGSGGETQRSLTYGRNRYEGLT